MMNQTYGMHPFEYAKNKISESATKLYKYIIWTTVLGVILAVIMVVTYFVLLEPLGFILADFDTNNIYTTGQALVDSGILETGIVAIIFLGIAGVGFLIFLVLSYIQYYKLGSAFSRLYVADPITETMKYISYGFYGYIIAIIASTFIPGIANAVVSILGNVSLAIAAYLIYQLFIDFKTQGRFKGKPSILLFIGLAINVVTSISSIFNTWGSFGSLVGFILMLMGFRDLSRDIRTVIPPTGQTIQPKVTPVISTEDSTISTEDIKTVPASERFCSNCGTKITSDVKFCSNCGFSV